MTAVYVPYSLDSGAVVRKFFFFFFTLVTGPRRSLSLKLSDTKVCEPQIRARLGNHNTTIIGVEVVELQLDQLHLLKGFMFRESLSITRPA